MAYLKICIICTTSFPCKRATALFCSDPCRNKGRSMKPELKLALIKRNSQYIMKANNYLAEVPDKNGNTTAIGYIPENVTSENPLGEDAGLLLAHATLLQESRNNQEMLENKQQSVPEDPEDIDPDLQQDFQESQKSLESNSGFSTVNENDVNLINEVRKPPQNTLQKYKIRPIGG
jgi:hypothetical protein